MSFLKKLNLKEKVDIAKDFSSEYLLVRRHLYAIGISLIFSFFVIQISIPTFYVSATLREAVAKPAPVMGDAAALFGVAGGKGSGAGDDFNSNMTSYLLAVRMWDQGWGSKVFGSGDLNDEYFNSIKKYHSLSDRLGAFILGYDLLEYYSANDLQDYIKGQIRFTQRANVEHITVSTITRSPEFAIDFMNKLLTETDRHSKERLILKSNEIISSTYKQLAISKNSSISSALADTINSEYYKIANLENDMPYLLYVVDPANSSEHPITPNLSAITISSAIIFLFFSISFSFIQKNKEDLW